ncbi:MAG: hypothetical protein AVDCRST_MAG37-3699, partial [uncultured Rubrobacteraceae bacterium]
VSAIPRACWSVSPFLALLLLASLLSLDEPLPRRSAGLPV